MFTGLKSRRGIRAGGQRAVLEATALEARTLFSTVINVNTFVDQVDAPGSTTVSLRDAITKGEATAGAVTVNVPSGNYSLTLGDLVVSTTSGNLTVQGTSGTPVLQGYSGRVVHVEAGATVAFTGLEITDGYLGSEDAPMYGGGIFNEGTLTLTKCLVDNNRGGTGNAGAGIYNSGTLTIQSSSVNNNTWAEITDDNGAGGGITNTGMLTVTNSTISGNFGGIGGGIDNSGTVQMSGSTVSGNTSYYQGGGVENSGSVVITTSTIANNYGSYVGAGIDITSTGTLTLTNCTVAGNSVDTHNGQPSAGGGLFNDGKLTIANTIVAGNIASHPGADFSGPSDPGPDVDGPVISKGHNLVGAVDGTSSGWTGSDLKGTIASPIDAKLSLLGLHGGITETMIPLPGSPAIDHGSNALAPVGGLDQRGLPRVVAGTVDIGATESPAANGFIAGTIIFDDTNTFPSAADITVYNDANNNDKLDAGEAVQVTNDEGQYIFTGLAAGNYKIREILPAGARQITPVSNFGWTIALKANQALGGTDFHAITTPGGSVSGIIFNDANGNGKQDSGEQPLSGTATVYDDANNNGLRDGSEKSVFVESNGYYDLTGLSAGTHHIREELISGWKQTSPANNAGLTVTFGSSLIVTGINFGQKALPPTGDISGTVFEDTNGNGVQDAGEEGRGNITVYNDANNNGKRDAGEQTVVTGAGGNYQFSSLPLGNYKIREVVPAGWKQINPSNNFGWTLSLTKRDQFIVANFTEQPLASEASIRGTVFEDTNGNLKEDAGEVGLIWELYIDSNNDGILDNNETSLNSDDNGAYSFDGLAAGTYIVRAAHVGGFTQTTPTNNLGQHATVAAGQVKSGILFGEQATGN